MKIYTKETWDIWKKYFITGKTKPIHRKVFFEKRFLFFMWYYFPREFKLAMADFQFEYIKALEEGKNIFFVGFRESAKSMILTYYYVWCIVFKRRKFLMHYNSELEQAKAMLRDVIYILENNEKLIYDFGRLYTPEVKKKNNKNPKKIGEFITENGVKMKAMSLGTSPRGQKFVYNGETYRPDLIGFDDIDTLRNTTNPDIIKKDLDFILNEVLGGVSNFAQIIILGNVVRKIGRSIQLKKHFEKDKSFEVFWLPVYDENKKLTWPAKFVFTDEEAEKLNKGITDEKKKVVSLETRKRQQGESAYNANYLLIPMLDDIAIIKKEHIHYYHKLPANVKYCMGIDPAFSEKTNTDPVGITITAHWKFEGKVYKFVVYSTKLEGNSKNYEVFTNFVKNLYIKYKVNIIHIENNNGGGIIASMLKNKNLAVKVISSTKDKVTRLREYEGEIQTGLVKFNPDEKATGELIEQLTAFPAVEHDDMVDSLVFSLYPIQQGEIKVL